MAVDIESPPPSEEKCSVVLEIMNAILAKSTGTSITDVIEDLPHAVTTLSPKNVIQQNAESKNSHTMHSSSESVVDSDSASDSGSSSASSSSGSSSSSCTPASKQEDSHHNKRDNLERRRHEEKTEDEAKHLRSKNEIDPDKITVPSLDIQIKEHDEIIPVGKIVSSMESVVIVSTANWQPNKPTTSTQKDSSVKSPIATDLKLVRALDHGSTLCFEDRTLLGLVDETFGPVERPFYVVRFNTVEERDAVGAVHGRMVYVVKQQSTWVRGSEVLSKGYDTSNWDDEECNVPDEYSDDEEERAAKQAQKRARAQKRENSMDNSNEVKRRRLSTSYPKREFCNTAEAYNKNIPRYAQRGRPRPRQGMVPNLAYRNDGHDVRRWDGGHAGGPIRNISQFGDQMHDGSLAIPNMPSTDAVQSSHFYAQVSPNFSHNMQTSGGYSEGPPTGIACPAPSGQAHQFYHRNDSHDVRRWGDGRAGRAGGPTHNAQYGGCLNGEPSARPNMPSAVAGPSSDFRVPTRPNVPYDMRLQRSYAEGSPFSAVGPIPSGQGRPFYHQGPSQVVSTLPNAYQSPGTGMPSTNVGVPNHSSGVYGSHGVQSYQQQFNPIPVPYWHENTAPRLHPQRDAEEVNQNNFSYRGPVGNQDNSFYSSL